MSSLSRITREIIWHFTCDSCKNWWSIASTDGWKPKALFCPHCGYRHKYDKELTEINFTDMLRNNLDQIETGKT